MFGSFVFQNLLSLKTYFFNSFSISHANIEAQKIKISQGFFKQTIDRCFLSFFLRKQGFAVTLAKLNDSYLLFKLKLLPNQSRNNKYLIFEDLCFQGILKCFPQTVTPWIVILIPYQDGMMSVSLIYNGILLYKRELLQGCDLEGEIISSLNYVRKFDLPIEEITGLLITKEQRDLPQIKDIPFKRVNADAQQLAEIGLNSKKKLVFNMPLTTDYLRMLTQRTLLKFLAFVSIPMLLISSVGLALHPYLYPQQELFQNQKEIIELEKSLIPNQVFSHLTQNQTSFKPMMQIFKEHLPPDNLPSYLELNMDKMELALTFEKPYVITQQLAHALKDYKIVKKSPHKILLSWKKP